jgi:hypothetical protein
MRPGARPGCIPGAIRRGECDSRFCHSPGGQHEHDRGPRQRRDGRKELLVIETYVGADERCICRPLGDLDWVRAFSLRHAIHKLLQPRIEILIDLSRIESVDATGISALVGSVRRVNAAGAPGGSVMPRR